MQPSLMMLLNICDDKGTYTMYNFFFFLSPLCIYKKGVERSPFLNRGQRYPIRRHPP